MKAHTPFELPDIHFPVPLGMEKHISQQLDRTFRVEVEWLTSAGNKDKVNGFDLSLPDPGKPAEVTAEEVAQICLAMANMHAEQDEADEARTYRVRQYWRGSDGDHRAFFKFVVRPAGEQQPETDSHRSSRRPHSPHDELGWGAAEDPMGIQWEYQQRNIERTQQQLVTANDMIMGQVDRTLKTILQANSQVLHEQRKMNEENRIALRESRKQTTEAQERLFQMALAMTAHNEQQEAIQTRALEMFSMGYQWFWHGMQQQMKVSERRHQDEIERLRQQRKEESRFSMIKEIGPALLMFGGGLLSKMGNSELGDMLQDVAAETAQEHQGSGAPAGFGGGPPPGFAGGPHGAPDGFAAGPPPSGFQTSYQAPASPSGGPGASVPPQPETPGTEHPEQDIESMTMTERAQLLGELITAEKWRGLMSGMQPASLQALRSLVTSSSDAEVINHMIGFTRALMSDDRGNDAFNASLSDYQIRILSSIIQAFEEAVTPSSSGEPPTPPMPGTAPAPAEPDVIPQPEPPLPAEPKQASSPGMGSAPIDVELGGASAPPMVDLGDQGDLDALDEYEPEPGTALTPSLLRGISGLRSAAIDILCERYATLEDLREEADEELLGIKGIGRVALRNLRNALSQ